MLLNGLLAASGIPPAPTPTSAETPTSAAAGQNPRHLPETNGTISTTANWITPSARDWKDSVGMSRMWGDRSRNDQLPRQMVQALDPDLRSGTTPTGSNAPMEKRGARLTPNPTFAMWLMSFPPTLSAAILRVCSSRPSKGARKHGSSPATRLSQPSPPRSSPRSSTVGSEP